MEIESRTTIHAGVNFVIAPFVFDRKSCARFQELISEIDPNLGQFSYGEREFQATRQRPTPLAIQVIASGPQVGQLVIIATQHVPSRDTFTAEADYVAQAFTQVWGTPKQILSCDATMRDLYETSSEHALIELWEKRLHQTPEDLQVFGRPVLGGGMRFVMPPPSSAPTDPVIELKIESLLQDARKLFFEAQFIWQRPRAPGEALEPSARLQQVDDFLKTKVVKFVMEGRA